MVIDFVILLYSLASNAISAATVSPERATGHTMVSQFLDAVDIDAAPQAARPNTVTQMRRRISIPCRRYSAIAAALSEKTCGNGISPRAEIWRDTAPSNI